MLLLRCIAQAALGLRWPYPRGSWPRVDPPWWVVDRPELKSRFRCWASIQATKNRPARRLDRRRASTHKGFPNPL